MANAVLEVRAKATRCYVYRTVTDQLADGLDHIQECGDSIITVAYLGGRDWVVVCQKAADRG